MLLVTGGAGFIGSNVVAEHIAHHDIGAAGVVQRSHDIRSDKTGPAGHQQHYVP